MRIVYLHQYFTLPSSPGGTRSYEMARRLVAAGHQVELITSDSRPDKSSTGWRESTEAGIRVHWRSVPYSNRMGWLQRMRAFLAFALAASRRAAKIDADVIFATSTPLTIAIPAIYASWRRRTPYVFEVRDVWPAVPIALGALRNPLLRRLAKWLEHHAYHRAAHVVALAPGMGEEVQRTGYPAERITIVPNGCDNDVFGAKHTPTSPSLIERQPWLGQGSLILFAGMLGRANNVGYVAEIAAEMSKKDPQVRFAVIGDGADRDRIQERAVKLDVLDKNMKLVPAIPKTELAAWIQRADICLALFSGPRILWKDAVQNKFFDALAAGKPVASNHRGWQCLIAEEHDVGFAIDSSDPAIAADELVRVLGDEAWRSAVPENAKKLANGEFSRDLLAQRLEQVLQTVADAR